MRRLAAGLLGRSGNETEDAVQEALLAALERPPAAGRPLRPWLKSVLANAVRSRQRAARREARRRERLAGTPSEVASPAELVEQAEVAQMAVAALPGLPEVYRDVLLLRYFEDLPAQRIAAVQELPAATVRTRVHRGLALLRERMEARHGADWRAAGALLLAPAKLREHPAPPATPRRAGRGWPWWFAAALLLAASGLAWTRWNREPAAPAPSEQPVQQHGVPEPLQLQELGYAEEY